jgi:hypothetical protein
MVVFPDPTAVAKPRPDIVATEGFVEVHVTVLVRFWLLASLKVPVAVNDCVAPRMIELFAGVTSIDTSVGGSIAVRRVEPLTWPELAWIVVLPTPTLVARPALVIVATEEFVELHITELVRFWVLPSLYVPVALKFRVVSRIIELSTGVTAIDTNMGGNIYVPTAIELLTYPLATAIALIVVVTLTAMGFSYTVDVVLGALPSVVK